MALTTAGLKTHIWNNNARSGLLLATYPFLMMALVWLCAWVVGMAGQNGLHYRQKPEIFASAFVYEFWPAILTIVIIWFIIAWFFHTSMIRKLSHSHPVTRSEEPELYNLLENLCIAQGMTMPRLEIIETHARNAFASGISDKTYTVTVTRGLMNSLSKDELEAVLAHELTHILNKDVRLLIITVIFTGMIGFAAQLVWSNIRYGMIFSGGRGNKKGGGILIMLGIALILWIGYMATLFMRFAISRRREFMADAGSVEMTKNPSAMMRALLRIAGKDRIPETTDDIAMMCIENKKAFMGLFATHPPIEKRIRAISAITGEPVPMAHSLPPVDKTHRFGSNNQTPQNPWLIRQRR